MRGFNVNTTTTAARVMRALIMNRAAAAGPLFVAPPPPPPAAAASVGLRSSEEDAPNAEAANTLRLPLRPNAVVADGGAPEVPPPLIPTGVPRKFECDRGGKWPPSSDCAATPPPPCEKAEA